MAAEQKQQDFEMQTEFSLVDNGTFLDENIESSSKAFYKEFRKVFFTHIFVVFFPSNLILNYFRLLNYPML
jgi:hypothetical protein